MSALPPPPPGAAPVAAVRPPERVARPGELTPAWRVVMILTWIGVFLAYMAVWKASDEIGIATWWLGPRSSPQPMVVRLIPFAVAAVFGILASYNVRHVAVFSLGGSVALAAIASADLSRSTGLALVEFAIAGAAATVSVAALSGVYRAAPASDLGRSPAGPVPPAAPGR
ncbi:MAG TPA: hypothetical protein VK853_09550 [Ilumatobacteraceae bacterium]|nr:hypothetical protein [Ilumatobacteraceae bacterium]